MSNRKQRENRGARISAEMVDPLSVTAIEDGLTDLLDVRDLQRLFSAVNPKFAEYEQRLEQHNIDEEAYLAIIAARQTAYFNLGFSAAVKLMGRTTTTPKLKAVG